MNFQKVAAKKDFSSQLLSQLSVDYPPPIWSLSSSHLITGFHWILLDLSDFFSYFSSYLQQMPVFRTPISCIAIYLVQVSARTSPSEWIEPVWCFPDSVLCLYYAAMPSVQLFDHRDFQRNISAGVSEYCQYWKLGEGKFAIYNGWAYGWRGCLQPIRFRFQHTLPRFSVLQIYKCHHVCRQKRSWRITHYQQNKFIH